MFNQQQDKLNQQWAELGEKITPQVVSSMELVNEAIDDCFVVVNGLVDLVQKIDSSFKDMAGVSYFELLGKSLKVVLKLLKGAFAVLGLVWRIIGKIGAFVGGALVRYFGKLYSVIKPVVDLLGKMLGSAYNSIDNALSPNKKKVYKTTSGRNLKEGEVYSYQKTENGKRYEYTKGIKNGKLVTIDKREISKVNQLNNVLGDNNKVLNKNKKSIVD